MLISKFDLCKSEWLDLVFAKRNKEYGAYYLRQHYADNIVKAMFITFISVTAIFVVSGMILGHHPGDVLKIVEVPLTTVVPIPPPPKKDEVHEMKRTSAPKQQFTTTKVLPPVVTADPVREEPKRLDDIKGEIGAENIDIPGDDGKGVHVVETGKGEGVAKAGNDNLPVDISGVDVLPEPVGGAAAWAKFLQKNLRYPGEAIDKGVSGKVYVTFIVEKDGSLSSITIARGMGYGLDEEALRVLKKAPAWKPGKQNGQPVRVKFTLPLNFVLNNDN